MWGEDKRTPAGAVTSGLRVMMIGKRVGSNLYIHKSAVNHLPSDIIDRVALIIPDYSFCDIAKINLRDNIVTFMEVEGFDSLDEPILKRAHIIRGNGKKIINYTKQMVYHHKWMMVDGKTYNGFDVNESMARTLWWTKHPLIKEIMDEDRYFKSRIGFMEYWEKILQRMYDYDYANKSMGV